MRVKCCGITRPEDALAAEVCGADAIGVVVFSPLSARSVTLERAQEIFDATGPFITTVAVTHTRSSEEIEEILSLRLDAIQIYHPFTFRKRMVPKILRVVGTGDPLPSDCDALIVDESHGGGRRCDLLAARRIVSCSRVPVILAGGLNQDNIADAIRQVRPYGVDVASGIESVPGIKDHRKIAAFISAAQGT